LPRGTRPPKGGWVGRGAGGVGVGRIPVGGGVRLLLESFSTAWLVANPQSLARC
jgi:hypothetical protein